jgi:hypothetical protein
MPPVSFIHGSLHKKKQGGHDNDFAMPPMTTALAVGGVTTSIMSSRPVRSSRSSRSSARGGVGGSRRFWPLSALRAPIQTHHTKPVYSENVKGA